MIDLNKTNNCNAIKDYFQGVRITQNLLHLMLVNPFGNSIGKIPFGLNNNLDCDNNINNNSNIRDSQVQKGCSYCVELSSSCQGCSYNLKLK